MEFTEKRKEYRISLDTVGLPLVGSRARDAFSFDYLLHDISMHGAQIAITSPVARGKGFKEGDTIDFHATLESEGQFFDQGKIRWIRQSDETGIKVLLGLALGKSSSDQHTIAISLETSNINIDTARFNSPEGMLLQAIGDSVAAQKDLLRAIDALMNGLDKSVPKKLRDTLVHLSKKTKKSCDQLKELSNTVDRAIVSMETDRPTPINIEGLRSLVVLKVSEKMPAALSRYCNLFPYLHTIKDLEGKLYTDHNTITMLYLGCLIFEAQEVMFFANEPIPI